METGRWLIDGDFNNHHKHISLLAHQCNIANSALLQQNGCDNKIIATTCVLSHCDIKEYALMDTGAQIAFFSSGKILRTSMEKSGKLNSFSAFSVVCVIEESLEMSI